MAKKLIAFDYDDTLAVTKAPITDRMASLLTRLLDKYELCVITGDTYEKIKLCVVDRLEVSPARLSAIHLMPACGTRYYRYDTLSDAWSLRYAEDLTADEKSRAAEAVERAARGLGYWEENPYSEVIEDRGSQITYSALGRRAPAEERYKWDPTGEKKERLREVIAGALPDLEVRAGGTTSIDITRIGVDKAYGMHKLMKATGMGKEDILFIGDNLQEGGNDYPVRAMGIDTIAVDKWEDTALIIEGLVGIS